LEQGSNAVAPGKFHGIDIPFARHCKIEPHSSEPGVCRLSVTIDPDLENNLGMAHGGLLLTMLDISLAIAARTLAQGPVMTVDMQAAFLAPANGKLISEGRVVRHGKSITFSEGEVRDESGVVVAKATGVFKAVRARPGTAEGGD
jgi:uncharacterized protein (TIGR00369 family)